MSAKRRQSTVAKQPLRAGHLRPPRSRSPAIERPFLETMLLDGIEGQVVVVRAPAGFGKTALLSSAYELAGQRTQRPGGERLTYRGWLTLGPAHGSATRLLADLCEALDLPATLPDTNAIHAAIEGRGGVNVLFVDNLDAARSPEADALFDSLVNQAPDGLRVVFATRARPRFPLVRLRLRGLLKEIGPPSLAFSLDEMRRLLDRGRPAEVSLVAQATQGWPALVSLFSASLDGEAVDRDRALARWDPLAFEFIEQTVLAPATADLREMLGAAAITEDFCVALASAIGGRDFGGIDAGQFDDVEPVVTKSQLGPGWYRLHPLVKRYFAARHPDGEDALRARHATASRWFAAHDFLEQAVAHATEARDFAFAAETIRNAGGVDLLTQVGRMVLERLVEGLPPEVIFSSPALSLSHGLILAKHGRLDEARLLLAQLREAPDGQAQLPPSSLDHIEGIIAIYRDIDIPRLTERLERKAAMLGPQAIADLAWINVLLCAMYTAQGRLADARKAVTATILHYRALKQTYSLIFAHVHLGLIEILEGNYSAAMEASRLAQELIQASYWNDSELIGISYVPTAELHYLRGEVEMAERLLAEAVPGIARGEGWVDIYERAFGTLARARMRLRGYGAASSVLDAMHKVAQERMLPRLELAGDILRIEFLLADGRMEAAELLAGGTRARLESLNAGGLQAWRQQLDFAVTEARLLLAQQRPDEALAKLEQVSATSTDSYHRLMAAIVTIRACWATGDVQRALEALRPAIGLASVHDVIQPFLDEGPALKTTLRALLRRVGLRTFSADAVTFLGRVIGNDLPATRLRRRDVRDAMPAPSVLTDRELEILRRMAEPASNKQIARSLGISEPTVKFHLKNVFAKLGVSRRDMAASVARRLSLI